MPVDDLRGATTLVRIPENVATITIPSHSLRYRDT